VRDLSKGLPKKLHLIRHINGDVPLIDTLPAYDSHAERLEGIDDLTYYIKQEFSLEAADNLLKIVEKCDDVFDLNLEQPPQTNLKEKVKFVTTMDLSDQDMINYGCVLMGAYKRFPKVKGQMELGKKYMRFLILNHLEMSPEEFAQEPHKTRIFKKYELMSFFSQNYGSSLEQLFKDVFPEVEPYKIKDALRWSDGREGLINAMNAIDLVVRKTKKSPKQITQMDFRKEGYGGMLIQVFGDCPQLAIEFRYPGTYLEYNEKAQSLLKNLLENHT